MGKGVLAMDTSRKRILCIDDHPDTCELLTYLLDAPGFEIVSVQNAADALKRIQGEQFDLCLLDNRLPDASGVEVCRKLRASAPQLPVIFISAAAYEEDIRRGLAAGASAYVTKPFEPDEVKRVVEQALGTATGPHT